MIHERSWRRSGGRRLQHLRIPRDRLGALIGKNGATKKLIEERTEVKLLIDSVEGDVEIDYSKASDPSMALVVTNIVKAIGRGFSPENALLLLEDDFVFELMDVRDFVGKKPNHVTRIRSRLIGTQGKTRKLIEELSDTRVSIFGNTVGIIGGSFQVSIAKRAIDMLISGSEHSTVYRFLEKNRAAVKIAEMGFD